MVGVGDVWRFSLVQRLFGQIMVNTFALRVEALSIPVEENDWVNTLWGGATSAINTRFSDMLAPMQTEQVEYLRWDVQRVDPNPTATWTVAKTGTLTGIREGNAQTANVAISITRKGAGPGKRERGRIAVGGIAAESYENGELGIIHYNVVNAVHYRMTGQLTGAGDAYTVSFGFWSPQHTALVGNPPVAVTYPPKYTPCVSSVLRTTMRVQRSRTVNVGM